MVIVTSIEENFKIFGYDHTGMAPKLAGSKKYIDKKSNEEISSAI